MRRLKELTKSEPNLCSIELIAEGGSIVIDQSLDVTLRFDLDKAMEAVRFIFVDKVDGDTTRYSLNRDFINHRMFRVNEPGFVTEGYDRKTGIKVIFRANKDSADLLLLLDAVRINGGANGIEKRLRERQ